MKGETPELVQIRFIDRDIRDDVIAAGPAERDRPGGIFARQEEIDRAVVVEVAGRDVLERRCRKKVEFPRGQREGIEHLRRHVLAFDLADQIEMRVVVELGDDAKQRRFRRERKCIRGFDESRALPQKSERRRAIVESGLGSFEQIELPVTIEIDP